MISDKYTKALLTVIAVMLTIIALTPLFKPATAQADGAFSGVQVTAVSSPDGYVFFDTRTGDIWRYNMASLNGVPGVKPGEVYRHNKLTKLGGRLTFPELEH